MNKPKRILISGASIAGPVLAFWLNKYGFEVTLIEKAPRPRPGGQAIDVRGKALEILARMGVLSGARELRTQMKGVSLQDADGNETWRSEERTLSGGRFENGDVELLRDDLAKLLLDRIQGVQVIDIRYGTSILSLDERAEGICATMQDGNKRIYDLVVGADGLHSNVRALVFGEESQFLRSLDLGLAVFSSPNILGLRDWQIAFRDDQGGYCVYTARENSELRIAVGFRATMEDERRGSVREQKALVADRCVGFRWEMPKLLKYMDAATDFYFGVAAQICMEYWSKGRVALVGDAAYCPSPFSGQGTSLAIVGAYVLAQELSGSEKGHAAAFERYETRMRPYVLINQALALRDQARDRDATYSDEQIDAAKNAIELD